jgi:hypothetical protein
MEVIHQSQRPLLACRHEFIGAEHGAIGASFFWLSLNQAWGRALRAQLRRDCLCNCRTLEVDRWNEECEAVAGDVLGSFGTQDACPRCISRLKTVSRVCSS